MHKYKKFIGGDTGLSYNNFFQFFNNNKIEETGLHKMVLDIFPIIDDIKKTQIDYIGYETEVPEYDWNIFSSQCISYTAKIKFKFLITVKDYKQHYDLNVDYVPIMLENNTFIINGIKKVMVYQLTKTGGIYYDSEFDKIRIARLVATNGSRIEIKINQRDILNIYVNISKKIMIGDFFSLMPIEKILRYLQFYKTEKSISIYKKSKNNELKNILIFTDIFSFEQINDSELLITSTEDLDQYIVSSDLMQKRSANEYVVKIESMYSCFMYFEKKIVLQNKKGGFTLSDIMIVNDQNRDKIFVGSKYISGEIILFKKQYVTLYKSFCKSNDSSEINAEEEEKVQEDSIEEDEETEEPRFEDQYDDEADESDNLSIFYNVDPIVRNRLNTSLNIKYSQNEDKFTEEDIINFLIHFESMVNKPASIIPNYDLLIYKRVKKPETFISSIIVRKMQKLRNSIKTLLFNKNAKVNIDETLNSYVITNDIRKIFNSHPLVQFLDQTNPLSEISHRHRISVFNLSNIERYQISFEGRDINPTYLNRICPVQTPEGANIGLINTLSIYAKIDDYGFIIAPYYKVSNGIIDSAEMVWLNPETEYNSRVCYHINNFDELNTVTVKYQDTFLVVTKDKVEYMAIDNYSMLSLAAAAIPYIMNNDARRALMGANMQRQATPLNSTDSPIVGTGVEAQIADISDMTYYESDDQTLVYSCASFIILADKSGKLKIRIFDKYQKTNMKTCINTRLRCTTAAGSLIAKKSLISEKGCSENGELALGRNLIVAFMTMDGYSFEDSIVISDKIVKYGYLDTIHMNDIDIKAKEIDGDIIEKFTKDNPNTYVANLKHLDDRGIVKIGVKIRPSKIIASRVVPMDTSISNEDSILSLIFGKHLSNYKDISYKANYDMSGTVIDVKYFNRSNDEANNYGNKMKNIMHDILSHTFGYILNVLAQKYPVISSEKISTYIARIDINKVEIISTMIDEIVAEYKLKASEVADLIGENLAIIKQFIGQKVKLCNSNKCIGIEHNIIEFARILVADKRTISIGDKLSGRHGNKGVVSYICPEVDMPFMEDGTTIDVLLNPISIPNRLNIGQVLETQLGLTAMLLKNKVQVLMKTNNPEKAVEIVKEYMKYNVHRDKSIQEEEIIATCMNDQYIKLEAPSFNSINMDDVNKMLKLLDHEDNGVFRLRHGITGQYITRKVKVAPKYIMKLNHMSKDKLTARETGGYSAILQQPLPRKSKHGGQRFGEMEAWASESYGASVFLRETLGPRSDDRKSRNLMYEWVLNRKYKFIHHLCETVNIITRYLNGGMIMLDFKKKIKKFNK